MKGQFKIDISQMGDVKIEQKDGFVIVTPIEEEKPVEVKKCPEKGYFAESDATVHECTLARKEILDEKHNRNLYPYRQHAELFGQVLAPLLVKHYVATGGYWEEKPVAVLAHSGREWVVVSCLPQISACMFPFPCKDMARDFLKKNEVELHKLTQLWQLKS